MYSARSPFFPWPCEPSCSSTLIRRATFESFQKVTRPRHHTLCCRTDNALQPTVNSPLAFQHVIQHVGRGLSDEPSGVGLCSFAPRTSPVFGQWPARRHRTCRSCQENLDTLRAWAMAAVDVRSAFLLVGIRDGSSTEVKEPITVPQQGEGRWRPTPRSSTASRTRCRRR